MNKLQEFWYCVAPQNDIPLYKRKIQNKRIAVRYQTDTRYRTAIFLHFPMPH